MSLNSFVVKINFENAKEAVFSRNMAISSVVQFRLRIIINVGYPLCCIINFMLCLCSTRTLNLPKIYCVPVIVNHNYCYSRVLKSNENKAIKVLLCVV